MNNNIVLLPRAVLNLLLIFLLFSGLYFSASFLMPVALAGLLAMLFLPMSRWLEAKGINRTITAALCIVVLLVVIAGFVYLISWRISSLQGDLDQIKQRFEKYISELQTFVNSRFGLSKEQQVQMLKKKGTSGAGNAAGSIASFVASLFGSITTSVLI